MPNSGSRTRSTKPAESSAPITHIEVVCRRGVERVAVAEVEWFEAERDYIRLHAPGGEFLIRRSMRALEAELDPKRFIRTHRSAIVNRDLIQRVEQLEGGRLFIRLASGKAAPVSAVHAAAVHALAAPEN